VVLPGTQRNKKQKLELAVWGLMTQPCNFVMHRMCFKARPALSSSSCCAPSSMRISGFARHPMGRKVQVCDSLSIL
jgi:hypothetical protein